jgi:glycerate-2-kinase
VLEVAQAIEQRFSKAFNTSGIDGERVKGGTAAAIIFELASEGYGSLAELKRMNVYQFFEVLEFHRTKQRIMTKKLKQKK